MLNKILYFVLIVIISGCIYNPDAGKFIQFTPLQVSKSNSILLDKFEFEGTELDQFYKKLIIRQIKSDLANASNIIIYDYNKKLPQNTLKDPDLIVNIKFFLNETDEELSYYTPISLYKSSTSTNYSGSGRNARQSRRSSSSSSHELTQLPLNYGFFEFKSEIRIYNRKDLSLSQSKSVGILKSYASNNRKENYPLYKKSFILNNLHEISGLIVNSILFSSSKIERKIENSYGSIFLKNIQDGMIQKELFVLENKVAFTLDFKEKSVYLYYLGLVHEIIGQPLIAYDYYEKSIKHDSSNNLPHLAIGSIDRNRKL